MNRPGPAYRLVGAFTLVVATGGCATLLGIDGDYGDAPDAAIATTSTASTGSTTVQTGSTSSAQGAGGASGVGGAPGAGGASSTASAGGASGTTVTTGGGSSVGSSGSGSGGQPTSGSGGSAPSDAGDASTGAAGSAGAGGSGGTAGGAIDAGSAGAGSGGAGSGGAGSGGAAGSTGGTAGAAGGVNPIDSGVRSRILRVQRGSTTIPAGASTQRVTLQSVNLARTFLTFGARFDNGAPANIQITGQLTSPTEVTFARIGAMGAPQVPIQYYVAEFESGVQVQRGATTMTAMGVNASLAAVDLSKSFPIISYRNTGEAYGLDDYVRAKLTSSTQVTFENNLAAPNGIVEWQVVTFDGATVRSGDVTIREADTQITAPLPTVNPAATWLVMSYEIASFSASAAAQMMVRGKVDSATQLGFRRSLVGSTGTLTWYAVSFDNGTRVQSGTSDLGAMAMNATAPLSGVDTAKTIAAAAGLYGRGGSTGFLAAANPGYASFTLDTGNGANLAIARALAGPGAPASVDWFAVTFY